MYFLYGRHPEIGMSCELEIKPRRSPSLGSYTQEIGPCLADRKSVFPFLAVVADASCK
jgi:hypothetical protein